MIRQTKNLVSVIFKKIRTGASIIVTLFYALYLFFISGLVTLKQFNEGIFHRVICLYIGSFFWAAILGACVTFGAIST